MANCRTPLSDRCKSSTARKCPARQRRSTVSTAASASTRAAAACTPSRAQELCTLHLFTHPWCSCPLAAAGTDFTPCSRVMAVTSIQLDSAEHLTCEALRSQRSHGKNGTAKFADSILLPQIQLCICISDFMHCFNRHRYSHGHDEELLHQHCQKNR